MFGQMAMFLMCFCAAVSAADPDWNKAGAWVNGKVTDVGEGVMKLTSRNAATRKIFPIRKDRKYLVSGKFKAGKVSGGHFYFGVMPLKGYREITPMSVNILPGTETVLAKDASKNDTLLYLKMSKVPWKAGNIMLAAFNVDTSAELLDLPNFNLSGIGIKSVKVEEGMQVVELLRPLQGNMPKDVSVREHCSGGYAHWVASWEKIPAEFTEFKNIFEGQALYGSPDGKWRNSTDHGRFIMLLVPSAKNSMPEILMRDISIREIK